MIKHVNNCVQCPQGCIGHSCSKLDQIEIVCDSCGDEAEYSCDVGDYCKSCMVDSMNRWWNNADFDEKIEMMNACYDIKIHQVD